MSPSYEFGVQRPCVVCRRALSGPLVRRTHCNNDSHPECVVAVMHKTLRESCYAQIRVIDEARRMQAAARGLGLASSRGNEIQGTAVGAVSAASLAAGYLGMVSKTRPRDAVEVEHLRRARLRITRGAARDGRRRQTTADDCA